MSIKTELVAQATMHLRVKTRLDAQLERMTKAMRKDDSSTIDDCEQSAEAEHYLKASRESFVHYYKAKEATVWILNRRRWEKYAYACDYLSEKMEDARLWYRRAQVLNLPKKVKNCN
jgi:hypothetical protein